jgi:hypothetical protein
LAGIVFAIAGGFHIFRPALGATTEQTTAAGVVVVGDVPALVQAIAVASRPITVRLKPGYYPRILIGGDTAPTSQPVTLESSDPHRRAIIGELLVHGAPSTVIRGVDFERQPGQEGGRNLALFEQSPRSHIVASAFRGQLDSPTQVKDHGLLLVGCDDARVEDSRFSGLRYGLGFYNADRLVVVRNEFYGMRTDGIRGEGADDLLIAGNVIADFHPADGDHPDGIQLWTNNQTQPTRGITIRGNIVARSSGSAIQGIFIRDTGGKLPFEDLDISKNLVIGPTFHGIAVYGARGLAISDNIVAGYPDYRSWIRLSDTRNVRLYRNSATQFVRVNSSHIDEKGNAARPPIVDREAVRAMISAWAATNADLGVALQRSVAQRR